MLSNCHKAYIKTEHYCARCHYLNPNCPCFELVAKAQTCCSKLMTPFLRPPPPPPQTPPPPPPPPHEFMTSFRPARSHMLLVLQDRQWALSRHLAVKVIPGTPFLYALCINCALSWATFLSTANPPYASLFWPINTL